MAENTRKGCNQKQKMLYLAKIFSEETDDEHYLTMAQIIDKLAAYGVNANRKTLYVDFDELRKFGLDIIATQEGRDHYYHLGVRTFELPELKLLVDSVQSAKFFTDRKSKELIKKLESLVKKKKKKLLHREVVITGRIKNMNEGIYYNVDILQDAISANKQVRFKYFNWGLNKKMVPRKDGAYYEISPWGLVWDRDNYYLIGYDDKEEKIKHYRVDKMDKLSLMEERRKGKKQFKAFDLPKYKTSLFGMFAGDEIEVTLEADNNMVGVMIDRFGKDIPISVVNENHFSTTVTVAMSTQFIGWLVGLGEGVKVVAPDAVVEKMKEEIHRLIEQYEVYNEGQ